MAALSDLLNGKPNSDIERAIDRAFINYGMYNVVGSFFDPDKRKRDLEERLLEQALTGDSLSDKIKSGVKWASVLKGPAKATISKLLSM